MAVDRPALWVGHLRKGNRAKVSGRATRAFLSSLKMVVSSVIARRLGLRLMRSSQKGRGPAECSNERGEI